MITAAKPRAEQMGGKGRLMSWFEWRLLALQADLGDFGSWH